MLEQAKGVLAERFGISVEEAFELLDSAARRHRLRLHFLAAEVVSSPKTPAVIYGALASPRTGSPVSRARGTSMRLVREDGSAPSSV